MVFDGETFDLGLDGIRLTSQLERVFWTMQDGEWLTYFEIAEYHQKTYGVTDSETGIAARIRDFRKERFGGYVVNSRRRSQGLWEFQLVL